MHLTFMSTCPFVLYYNPYEITVMIECITMNWDQCRDIKYDTLTQNSIQWKWEIIDYFGKLLSAFIPSTILLCLQYSLKGHDCQQRKIKPKSVVSQTLILMYTISCFSLFLFFFVDNHVLLSYIRGITVWWMEWMRKAILQNSQ